MAVVLFTPTSNTGNPPIDFTWNSDDGSYCYDNFINFYDQSFNLIESSGQFNPNGGDSFYTLQSLPAGITGFTFEISCNPANTLLGGFTVPSTNPNQPFDDPNQPTTTAPVDNGTGTTTVQVVIPADSSIALDSGITPQMRDEFISGAAAVMVSAFGVALVLRMLR